MLTAVGDPDAEGWRCADELEDDPTADELAHALPADATVCVLGWPELAGEALARRGDVEVLAVDALDEGSGPRPPAAPRRRRRHRRARVAASARPCAAADLVLLEASAIGPDGVRRRRRLAGRRRRRPPRRRAGVGRSPASAGACPRRCSAPCVARLEAEHGGEPWEAADEVVPAALVDRVVHPGRARSSPASPSPTPTAPSPPSCSGPCPAC